MRWKRWLLGGEGNTLHQFAFQTRYAFASPGISIKCRFWLSSSGVGPKMLRWRGSQGAAMEHNRDHSQKSGSRQLFKKEISASTVWLALSFQELERIGITNPKPPALLNGENEAAQSIKDSFKDTLNCWESWSCNGTVWKGRMSPGSHWSFTCDLLPVPPFLWP